MSTRVPISNPTFSGTGDGNGAVISNFGGLNVGYLDKKEICFGLRSGGKEGSGSWDDPFDASSMVTHDLIWKNEVLPVNEPIVRYREGEYETSGSFSYNETDGFYVPSGCKIYGAGKGATVIKSMFYPVAAGGAGHTVFESRLDTDGAGIEIDGMTIDCNWQNLDADVATRANAVSLHGNDCKIRNIVVLNAYGNLDNLLECFELGIGCHQVTGVFQDCTGALIEGCLSRTRQGNYHTVMSLSSSDQATGLISGVIRDNEVYDLGIQDVTAFGFQGKGGKIIDNFTENCVICVYHDTGHSEDLIISRNLFLNCKKGIYHTPGLGDPLCKNIEITGNHIEVADATPVNLGIGVGSSVFGRTANYRIAGNFITKKVTGGGEATSGIAVNNTDGIVIEGNIVDSAHDNNLFEGVAPNGHITVRNNLTEEGELPSALGTVTSVARPDNNNSALVGSLKLQATYTDVDGSVQYYIAQSYTIVSGDYLSFEVFCHEANVSFTPEVILHFTDTTQTGSIADQNGLYASSEFGVHAMSDLSSYAAGAWYRRTFSLEDFIGKITDRLYVQEMPEITGTNKHYFRQIRINTSAGVLKKAFLEESDSPPTTVYNSSLHATNYSFSPVAAQSLICDPVPSNYADNAAALIGGLTAGMLYRTTDTLKVVH